MSIVLWLARYTLDTVINKYFAKERFLGGASGFLRSYGREQVRNPRGRERFEANIIRAFI